VSFRKCLKCIEHFTHCHIYCFRFRELEIFCQQLLFACRLKLDWLCKRHTVPTMKLTLWVQLSVIFLHRDCNKTFKPNACFMYYKINSTTSPASGAGNVSEPRLMSQVGGFPRSRARADRRVCAVRAVQVWVFVCLRNCCNHMTEGGGS